MAEQIISASGVQYPLVINPDGSINVAGTIAVSNIGGSIFIGSVSASVDSIYVQSGDNINITSLPSVVGVSGTYFQDIIGSVRTQTVQITNPWIISGVVDTQLYAGSKVWQGERWGISGNVIIENPQVNILLGSTSIYNRVAGSIVNLPGIDINNPSTIGSYTTQQITGSVAITTSILGVSGTLFQNIIGSVRSDNVQVTSPWVISGNVLVSGIIGVNNLYQGSKSWVIDTTPINIDKNNSYFTFIYMISGTATGITGSSIGSIVQFIGAGSYVKKLTWNNDLITNIGSWV